VAWYVSCDEESLVLLSGTADFRDSAFIYIGGLPFTLSEGDIVTIFSQFGEPVYINLVRDQETGKSKGFAFLKYEDQRSTDLAVDNLGGATLMGRILRVDHTNYKRKDEEAITDNTNGTGNAQEDGTRAETNESEEERPLIEEERELAELMRTHDDDDPMKEYLVKQKKEEVEAALAKARRRGEKADRKERHHKHHHSRRSRKEEEHYRSRRDRQGDEGKRERSQTPPQRNDQNYHRQQRGSPSGSRDRAYRKRSRSREWRRTGDRQASEGRTR